MGLGLKEVMAAASLSVLQCNPSDAPNVQQPSTYESILSAPGDNASARDKCRWLGDLMHNQFVQWERALESDFASWWDKGNQAETNCLRGRGLSCENTDGVLCREDGSVSYHGRIPYGFERDGYVITPGPLSSH